MKEYGIYIRCNRGTPYMLHFYDNITSAKLKLYDMISLDEERGKAYYVDNDFFNNKYSSSSCLKYYCIKVRDVSDFDVYSEEKAMDENEKKIVYLFNFKK